MSSAATVSSENGATEHTGADLTIKELDSIRSQLDTAASAAAKPQHAPKAPKRALCPGCGFPPRTCLCPSLPPAPLAPLLRRCRVVVLQHPHEIRRKNSSLPLVELCLFGKGCARAEDAAPVREEDFAMKVVAGRCFGEYCDAAVMDRLRDPSEVVVLVYPHPQAVDLEEGIKSAEERCGISDGRDPREGSVKSAKRGSAADGAIDTKHGADDTKRKKMTLVFLDATWKHAREMYSKTENMGEWPADLIRVQLTPTAAGCGSGVGRGGGAVGATFVERRFGIRAPPSPDHLSTAECVARVLALVERDPSIYQGITRTLDYMVGLWQTFTKKGDGQKRGDRPRGSGVKGVTGGDGRIAEWDSMTQKKRKITPALSKTK